MKSLFGTLGLSALFAVTLCGQSTTTQTNPETQNTGQTSSAPTGMTVQKTPTGQAQTWTGTLIDANCTAVRSMRPAVSSNAPPKKVGETIEGGSAEREANSRTTTASREEKSRTTESSDSGARTRTKTETSSQSNSTMSTSGSAADPYPACHVTSSTSSFAVSSNGQVFFLDQTSNARVRQQLQTDSSFSQSMSSPNSTPLSVVVMGNANGPEITVTTLQKSK